MKKQNTILILIWLLSLFFIDCRLVFANISQHQSPSSTHFISFKQTIKVDQQRLVNKLLPFNNQALLTSSLFDNNFKPILFAKNSSRGASRQRSRNTGARGKINASRISKGQNSRGKPSKSKNASIKNSKPAKVVRNMAKGGRPKAKSYKNKQKQTKRNTKKLNQALKNKFSKNKTSSRKKFNTRKQKELRKRQQQKQIANKKRKEFKKKQQLQAAIQKTLRQRKLANQKEIAKKNQTEKKLISIKGVDSARQAIANSAKWRGNKLEKHAWKHSGLAKNSSNQLPNSKLYDQGARQNILDADIVVNRKKGDTLYINSQTGLATGVQTGKGGQTFINSYHIRSSARIPNELK